MKPFAKKFPTQVRIARRPKRRSTAFTLLQILAVIGIIALLGAILFPVFARSRAAARRATCDVRLKAIALALDAYREENGCYPLSLEQLRNNKYLRDPDALRCPSDPRPEGQATYDDYYLVRSAHPAPGDHADQSTLPVVVCPFHEEENGGGEQAYKGRYVTQFAAVPARIETAIDARVQRPGKEPIAAAEGMTLHGGDRIIVGTPNLVNGIIGSILPSSSGVAVISFADGSSAQLDPGSDVTVLQSFVMGHEGAPLYSLVKQKAGRVVYRVNHGSRFDVGTPTATAGARGTQFIITINPTDGSTELYVEQGTVLFSTSRQSVLATVGKTVDSLLGGLLNIL